jgi:hypothetical protein
MLGMVEQVGMVEQLQHLQTVLYLEDNNIL